MDLLIGLIFLAGLCVMLYPSVSDYINRVRTNRALKSYERSAQEAPEDMSAVFEAAREYNRRLKENPNPFSEERRGAGIWVRNSREADRWERGPGCRRSRMPRIRPRQKVKRTAAVLNG